MNRDLATVETETREWKDHKRTLAQEFRESFSDTVKAGIMLQMFRKQAHDFILQTLHREVKLH